MTCYQRVILVGHLTHTPQLNFTADNGTAVCDVGLAINERNKKDDQWIEEVLFIDVTYWGKLAKVLAEYCPKGTPLLVEGRLKLDTWEKDGQKRSKIRVVAQQMKMLGGPKKGDKQSSDVAASDNQEPVGASTTDDEAPF